MPEDRAGQNYGPCDLFGHHFPFELDAILSQLLQCHRCKVTACPAHVAFQFIAPDPHLSIFAVRFTKGVNEVHCGGSVQYVFHLRCPFLSWGIFKHYFVI